ncbi:hypothetical protein [Streptomyces sp. NPDC001985]|uniref:hypothetical protein n=1 Tax=Streptomyces sp. NPDC001985 TaxID=3154406 RepID=UPI003328E06E
MSEESALNKMRHLVASYDSLDDPYLRSEFLDMHGMTRETIATYRRLITAEERRASATPSATAHSTSRRTGRARRGGGSAPLAPPGHPGSGNRRRPTISITVRIILEP